MKRKYSGCLSYSDTLKAWKLEMQGEYRWKVAQEIHCCERTIVRSYQHYGLENPKKNKRKSVQSRTKKHDKI